MRILYGVVGEGMGHAMRSAVLLEYLESVGHEIRIVGSGRATDYLEVRHPGKVTTITGLTMAYEDNVVMKRKALLQNVKSIKGIPQNLKRYAEMVSDFAADLVISDFESWSYLFAKGLNIPIISIDNMQVIARCHHSESVLKGHMKSFLLAKSIVRSKLVRCNHYLITTFFYPPVKRDRTTLHPPILRKAILEAKNRVRTGNHVLVYQSGTSHDTLAEELSRVDASFRIYGLRRDLTEEVSEGNITYCPFSESRFIEDMATCRAIIAGGGFTTMGEAVYLGKPMLSVPLSGQFEQTLNAGYLAELGYGAKTEHIDVEGVQRFLDEAERFSKNLAAFEHDQNAGLFAQLEQSMIEAVAEGPRIVS